MNKLYDYKFYDQLVEITERLVNIIMVDQIYISNYRYKSTKRKELVILLPYTNKQHITEAKALVGTVVNACSHFKSLVYYVDEIRLSIKNGGIGLMFRCHPDNLLYINPYEDLVAKEITSRTSILKKANDNLLLEEKKIESFSKGAEFYLKENDLQLCSFMVHQVFELSYRMAEIVFLGRDKLSHCIRSHHKLMIQYLPEIVTIFDRNKNTDMRLVNLLDEAYLTVRYENSYQISKTDLDILIMKSIDLQEVMKNACKEIINYYSISAILD